MSYANLIAFIAAMVFVAPHAMAQSNDGLPAGIGMAFDRSPDNRVRVGGVLPDGPAQRAGISAGDLVLAIDGVDVRNLTDEQIPQKIRGQKGTDVMLVVLSPGQRQPREVRIRRDIIPPRAQQQQPPNSVARTGDPSERKDRPAPPPQAQVGTQPASVQKFSLMTIKDPGVNNIAAVQVMVPQGWQMVGRVVWLPEYSVASNLELVLRDPQSGMSIQWLPTQSFTFMANAPMPMQPGTNYMGRVWRQPIANPAEFAQWFYAQPLAHLRAAKLVASEDFPNQAQYYRAQMTAQGDKHVRTVRMRYEFNAPDGRPWEEDVFLTLAFTSNPQLVFWDVFAATSVRGPKGLLDQMGSVTRAVLNSTQFTPEWLAARNVVQQLFTQGLKQMMRDTAVMGQKLSEYRAHISKMSQQIHEDRVKSMDARNEAFREVLGGVENYKDPFQSQPVYLPAGYKEYWANPKGEYILSERSGYDPNVGATTEWRKIERIDPLRR